MLSPASISAWLSLWPSGPWPSGTNCRSRSSGAKRSAIAFEITEQADLISPRQRLATRLGRRPEENRHRLDRSRFCETADDLVDVIAIRNEQEILPDKLLGLSRQVELIMDAAGAIPLQRLERTRLDIVNQGCLQLA